MSQESTTNEILFCVSGTVSLRQIVLSLPSSSWGTTFNVNAVRDDFHVKMISFSSFTQFNTFIQFVEILNAYSPVLAGSLAMLLICCNFDAIFCWNNFSASNHLWFSYELFFTILLTSVITYIYIQVWGMNVPSYAIQLAMGQKHRFGFDWIAILFAYAVHISLKIYR